VITEQTATAGTVGATSLAVTALVTVIAAARGVWSPCGLSMISAINPFTERVRGNRYWLTASWFIAGALLGGALLGALAAVVTVLLAALWPLFGGAVTAAAIAGGCCLIAVASDCPAVRFALPDHPRQVNERWLDRYRRWVYAVGFGVQIGCGFATYIMTAANYLLVVLAALTGSPTVAFAVGLLFGLIRGAAVLVSSAARDPAALRRLHRRIDLLAPWSLRAAILVQAAAAVLFGYLSGGPIGAGLAVALLTAGGCLILRRGRDRVPVSS